MSTKNEHHQTVPLSVLLKRELLSEKIENPDIVHGQAGQSKKGEDFTLLKSDCQRMVGDGVYTYSVYGVCLMFLTSCFCRFNHWFSYLNLIGYMFKFDAFYAFSDWTIF
jgi:hypothetical protein